MKWVLAMACIHSGCGAEGSDGVQPSVLDARDIEKRLQQSS